MRHHPLRFLLLCLVFLLVLPAFAFADGDPPPLPDSQVLPYDQFYALVLGAVVPLITYLLNHYGAWTTEPVKSVVTLLVSAAVGAAYRLLDAGELNFDTQDLQVIATTVVGTFAAHVAFYKPAEISAKLKAGTNAQDRR